MAAKPEVIEEQKKLAESFLKQPEFLNGLARQHAYLAMLHFQTPPCWSCGEPVDYLSAVSEAYDPTIYRGADEPFTCPHCQVRLSYVVPFVAIPNPWFWGNPRIYEKKEEDKPHE